MAKWGLLLASVVVIGRPARLLLMLAYVLVASHVAEAQPREPVFLDIRLMAADLIDDMVYSWLAEPPVSERRQLVLADISAPVGLDDRFNVLVENRLFDVLRMNPSLPVVLVHCGLCRRFIAKSTPAGTILSRGIDQPEVLGSLIQDTPGRLALSLNFEAEERELVLRAHIFELAEVQRIIWAKTFSTSMSSPRVLRDAAPLISLETAREQQRQILDGRDTVKLSTRIAIRMFNSSSSGLVDVAPLPFLEQSMEVVAPPLRQFRAAATVGFTSLQDNMSAWSVGGHLAWLMFRKTPSLIDPDLYWTFGVNYIRMRGPGAAAFGKTQDLLGDLATTTREPKATLVAYRLGIEAHIKYRLGMMAFLEHIPLLKNNDLFEKRSFIGVPYTALGWGVLFQW